MKDDERMDEKRVVIKRKDTKQKDTKRAEIHLMSEEEVALVKLKLGKARRTERDWSVIKEILVNRDMIVPESLDSDLEVRNVEGAMYIDRFLIAFTNMEDCNRQMEKFSQIHGKLNWRVGYKPWTKLARLADYAGLVLCIDMNMDGKNRFVTYSNERVEASLMEKI